MYIKTHARTRAHTYIIFRYCPFNFRSIKLMFYKLTFRQWLAKKKRHSINILFCVWPSYQINTNFYAINHHVLKFREMNPNWKTFINGKCSYKPNIIVRKLKFEWEKLNDRYFYSNYIIIYWNILRILCSKILALNFNDLKIE